MPVVFTGFVRPEQEVLGVSRRSWKGQPRVWVEVLRSVLVGDVEHRGAVLW